MNVILGGITVPREPDIAERALENPASYPWATMAGIRMDPMAATVAVPDPEMAAKNKAATTATYPSPP